MEQCSISTIEKEKPAPAPKMFKVTIYSGEDATDKGDVRGPAGWPDR